MRLRAARMPAEMSGRLRCRRVLDFSRALAPALRARAASWPRLSKVSPMTLRRRRRTSAAQSPNHRNSMPLPRFRRQHHRGAGRLPFLADGMAAQRGKAFLRIGQRCPAHRLRRIAILQMRHQPARPELRDPGRIAGARHQRIAQRRGAVQHQGGAASWPKASSLGLAGSPGSDRESSKRKAIRNRLPLPAFSTARRSTAFVLGKILVDPPILERSPGFFPPPGLPARPPPSHRGR